MASSHAELHVAETSWRPLDKRLSKDNSPCDITLSWPVCGGYDESFSPEQIIDILKSVDTKFRSLPSAVVRKAEYFIYFAPKDFATLLRWTQNHPDFFKHPLVKDHLRLVDDVTTLLDYRPAAKDNHREKEMIEFWKSLPVMRNLPEWKVAEADYLAMRRGSRKSDFDTAYEKDVSRFVSWPKFRHVVQANPTTARASIETHIENEAKDRCFFLPRKTTNGQSHRSVSIVFYHREEVYKVFGLVSRYAEDMLRTTADFVEVVFNTLDGPDPASKLGGNERLVDELTEMLVNGNLRGAGERVLQLRQETAGPPSAYRVPSLHRMPPGTVTFLPPAQQPSAPAQPVLPPVLPAVTQVNQGQLQLVPSQQRQPLGTGIFQQLPATPPAAPPSSTQPATLPQQLPPSSTSGSSRSDTSSSRLN